ncbi:unnamed protein product [Oppiella nova]|uniref:Uncharacterized protein n=1 Tax=Oppiella nova TaxID=334625 RepID=A0A7R9MHL2_9ACAR|nr:unnamed protein product [Oppiella nova]CAG2177530.1 unnamed protein product [Oppiella nova]
MFSQIIVLTTALTYASAAATLAEDQVFIACAKAGSAALNGLTSQQLFDLTQQNLVTASAMVQKRADAAQQQGLVCYANFNNNYGPGVLNIMGPTGEPQVLSTATSDDQKAEATKEIAQMTQLIICDEQYRAKHINDTISCNFLEQHGGALAEFDVKLPILNTVMGAGGTLLKGVTPPMASVVSQIGALYQQLYATGKQCSENLDLSTPQGCANLKMFDNELDRLGELGALAVASNLPIPI